MTTEVTCFRSNDPLRSAITSLVERHLSCIVIVDDEMPVGIITERDLVKILLAQENKNSLDVPISQFMSSPIISLHQNQSLFDALVISRAQQVRHLPVIENNKLIGLVTLSDLASAHFRVVEKQSEIIEQSIKDKTQELKEANKELLALSMEDHLLGIGNRRSMEVDLDHTHAIAVRYNRPYAIVLIDIDYFKLYNDRYGHAQGDIALKAVADLLKNSVRESDRVYRYGGEELLLLLPDTDAASAQVFSQRLLLDLYNQNITHNDSPFQRLTSSAGVSSSTSGAGLYDNWQAVVKEADRCLYKSKLDGRNRSTVLT
jgi:diguanylate cyclase (GGDEF)-like protein